MSRTLSLWRFVDYVSENYHSGGAVVIVADDYQAAWRRHAAKQIAEAEEYERYRHEALAKELPEPDAVFTLQDDQPEDIVEVFPDAGCC